MAYCTSPIARPTGFLRCDSIRNYEQARYFEIVGVKTRQWSAAALALGLLFASLPLTAKVITGYWQFEDAGALAALCFATAGYLYIRTRRFIPAPDSAVLLGETMRWAERGRVRKAIRILTRATRMSPYFWQAYEYRGKLYLVRHKFSAALHDFEEAVTLAPHEPHLDQLRAEAQRLMWEDELLRRS